MIIDKEKDLHELCDRLGTFDSFALDTEFVRERTFYIQLGIIQVAAEGVEAVIDPLAVPTLDPLLALIRDERLEKIVHAGEQDFAALYERAEVVPKNVFDTQVAAALVGYGDQISYAKLVQRVTGVGLSKLETLTDWTARPLTKAQIKYSLEDVRYLPEVRRHLGKRLSELGRAGWEREECERLESEETYRTPAPDEYYERLKRSGLNGTSLGVLRDVAAWREETARGRNIPRGWVLRDQSIVEIARRKPTSLKGLRQVRSVRPQQLAKDGDAIVASVKRGMSSPLSDETPPRPRAKAPPQLESVARLLEAWLYARAADEEIAPTMLATRDDLKSLVAGFHRDDVPELMLLEGWRRDLVGQELLDILEGRRVLRVDARSGKIVSAGATESRS